MACTHGWNKGMFPRHRFDLVSLLMRTESDKSKRHETCIGIEKRWGDSTTLLVPCVRGECWPSLPCGLAWPWLRLQQRAPQETCQRREHGWKWQVKGTRHCMGIWCGRNVGINKHLGTSTRGKLILPRSVSICVSRTLWRRMKLERQIERPVHPLRLIQRHRVVIWARRARWNRTNILPPNGACRIPALLDMYSSWMIIWLITSPMLRTSGQLTFYSHNSMYTLCCDECILWLSTWLLLLLLCLRVFLSWQVPAYWACMGPWCGFLIDCIRLLSVHIRPCYV